MTQRKTGSPLRMIARPVVSGVMLVLGMALATWWAHAMVASIAAEPWPLPTATVTATWTPTPRPPTSTPTPTATPQPTPTPTATATPTPTPDLCRETTGTVQRESFYSATLQRDQFYRIYLPPCYHHPTQRDRRYPVLYLIHGSNSDDAHWDDLGVTRAAEAGFQAGTLPPMIIVMPFADPFMYSHTSGGDQSFEGIVVHDLIPFIDRTYRTETSREGRAIGGISRGGVWSLEIAFRHPDLFCAVGGHSAALNVNLAGPAYDPIYLAADPALRSLRIYLDVGDIDYTRPGVEDLHQALARAGIGHIYEIQEGDHVDATWAAHMADYLAFYAQGW